MRRRTMRRHEWSGLSGGVDDVPQVITCYGGNGAAVDALPLLPGGTHDQGGQKDDGRAGEAAAATGNEGSTFAGCT